MSTIDLKTHFARVDTLVKEIELFVPREEHRNIRFRSDLAGLLIVLIVATYENCVKETLVNYASGHHEMFGEFARNRFERLNSRIAVQDLKVYTKQFNTSVHAEFKRSLCYRKNRIQCFTGQDVEKRYELLLRWRHEFAHAGNRITTIEEAIKTHRIAKHVLYAFDSAFNSV